MRFTFIFKFFDQYSRNKSTFAIERFYLVSILSLSLSLPCLSLSLSVLVLYMCTRQKCKKLSHGSLKRFSCISRYLCSWCHPPIDGNVSLFRLYFLADEPRSRLVPSLSHKTAALRWNRLCVSFPHPFSLPQITTLPLCDSIRRCLRRYLAQKRRGSIALEVTWKSESYGVERTNEGTYVRTHGRTENGIRWKVVAAKAILNACDLSQKKLQKSAYAWAWQKVRGRGELKRDGRGM